MRPRPKLRPSNLNNCSTADVSFLVASIFLFLLRRPLAGLVSSASEGESNPSCWKRPGCGILDEITSGSRFRSLRNFHQLAHSRRGLELVPGADRKQRELGVAGIRSVRYKLRDCGHDSRLRRHRLGGAYLHPRHTIVSNNTEIIFMIFSNREFQLAS